MKRSLAITILLFASSQAIATVTEWGGAPAGDFTIDLNDNVTILGAGTFKFQSVTAGNLGSIRSISVANGVTGTVIVHVARNPADSAGMNGATNVGEINLTNDQGASLIGNLAELRITGDLGSLAPTVIRNLTGAISANDFLDTVTIENNLTVSGSISANDVTGNITTGRLLGNVSVNSLADLTVNDNTLAGSCGNITIAQSYSGNISFARSYHGVIEIGTKQAAADLTGNIDVAALFSGNITVYGDLAVPGRVHSKFTSGSGLRVHVLGSITGSGATDEMIEIGNTTTGGELVGRIAIDGALNDAATGDEIKVGSLGTGGAIAINYDAAGSPGTDVWKSGATIQVGATEYTRNTPSARVYEITQCRGDMNNDERVDLDDGDVALDTGLWFKALTMSATYDSENPGLEGSRDWHGDADANGSFDSSDETRFGDLVAANCCEIAPDINCIGDLNGDGVVDLTDLSIMLSNFGTPSGATFAQGDMNGDGDVDLEDLAQLLAAFGKNCPPCGGDNGFTGNLTLSITALDTAGFTGGGFSGEVDHFVFDAFIDIDNTPDDWTTSGVVVTAANGATLRLAPTDPNSGVPIPGATTEPEKYTTFFSVPKNVNGNARFTDPLGTKGAIAGECQIGQAYAFTTTKINACWYDNNATSQNANAAVLRIVFDVSGVTGADTSSGFGAVYYSETGPANSADVKIADVDYTSTHKAGGGTKTTKSGVFYVKG